MKYKLFWALVFLAIFLDFGLTVFAVNETGLVEQNPVTASLMDEVGDVAAMLLSVAIRSLIVITLMIIQYIVPAHEWVVPTIVLPTVIAPVLWNVWLLLGTL